MQVLGEGPTFWGEGGTEKTKTGSRRTPTAESEEHREESDPYPALFLKQKKEENTKQKTPKQTKITCIYFEHAKKAQ